MAVEKKKRRWPPHFIRRCFVLLVGLCFMGAGVAFTIRANLGTSPLSSLPYVISLLVDKISIGTATVCLHALFILLQLIILRKKFDPFYILQLPVAIAFGYLTDLFNFLFQDINPNTYWQRCLLCVVGVLFCSFGVALEVMSRTFIMPAEGLIYAIADVAHAKFTTVKVIFDVSMVVIAFLVGLIATGGLVGVREGTIFAAVFTGILCEQHLKYLRNFERAFLM